jgi:hypothetical protein
MRAAIEGIPRGVISGLFSRCSSSSSSRLVLLLVVLFHVTDYFSTRTANFCKLLDIKAMYHDQKMGLQGILTANPHKFTNTYIRLLLMPLSRAMVNSILRPEAETPAHRYYRSMSWEISYCHIMPGFVDLCRMTRR